MVHAQKLAPDALVRLASLFPRICILCYATSCTSQIHAWPASLHARLNIIDTATVNQALGIEQYSHHYKVAHAYAYVLQRHLSEVESVLVLEADWLGTGLYVGNNQTNINVTSINKWLMSESWLILRLGYHPYDFHAAVNPCPQECKCHPSNLSLAAPICTITSGFRTKRVTQTTRLGRLAHRPYCDIRSTVGQAFHQRSLEPIGMYARLIEQQELHVINVSAKASSNMFPPAIDVMLPMMLSRVDYLMPALLTQDQGGKRIVHKDAQGRFMKSCFRSRR